MATIATSFMSTADSADTDPNPARAGQREAGHGHSLKPKMRFGGYEIVRELGEGGMGAVWEARHIGLSKRVAIKTLKSEVALKADVVERFIREGKAAARMRHANAADVTDVGVVDGVPHLVMEFLEGESLAARLERGKMMPLKEAVNILVPILMAIQTAHEEGIVHRDIKPDNIFLARDRDGRIVPKLLDFGISKLADDSHSLTQTASFMGTPYYMSPEQAADSKRVDARTDVYSLGVVLYECLAGAKPFHGTTVIALMHAICSGEYIPLQQIRPDLPSEVIKSVDRSLRIRVDERYATARAFAANLLPYAGTSVRTQHGPSLGFGDATAIVAVNVVEMPSIPSPTPSPAPAAAQSTARVTVNEAPTRVIPLALDTTVRRSEAPPKKNASIWVGVSVAVAVAAGAAWMLLQRSGDATAQPAQHPPAAMIATPVPEAPVAPVVVAPTPAPPQPTVAAPVIAAPEVVAPAAQPPPAPAPATPPTAPREAAPPAASTDSSASHSRHSTDVVHRTKTGGILIR